MLKYYILIISVVFTCLFLIITHMDNLEQQNIKRFEQTVETLSDVEYKLENLEKKILILKEEIENIEIEKEDIQTNEDDINIIISEMSQKYGFPEYIIKGMIDLESNWNPDLVGKSNDRGLMQITPIAQIEIEEGLGRKIDVFNIRDNIDGGCWYLLKCYKFADKNISLALSMYNVGPVRAKNYYKKNGKYFNKYQDIVLKRAKKYM